MHLINDTAPIMLTSSARKQLTLIRDEDCEIGSDDEVSGFLGSPEEKLPQYSDYDSDGCSPRKQRKL